MKHHQKDLTQAYDFVKQRRPCISPNLHFMGQLLAFQKQLQSATSPSSNESDQTEEMDCELHVEPSLCTPLPTENVIDFTTRSTPLSNCASPIAPPAAQDMLLHSPCLAHQIPVSIPHRKASDCSSARASKRSVSVPGSLNFNLARPKRKTLCAVPKFPVRYNQALMEFHCSTDSVLHSRSSSTMSPRPTKLNFTSISLPTTPVNHSKNHLLTSNRLQLRQTQGSTNTRLRRTLQLSPCRVEAAKNWGDSLSAQSRDLSPIPTTIAL